MRLALVILFGLLPACNSLTPSRPWNAQGEAPKQRFAEKVAPAGDVNGDGYADIAVWASGWGKSRGKVYVYLGSPLGPAKKAAFAVEGEGPTDQYGHSFGGMGDVNGDGYGDFLVAAQNFSTKDARDAGKAYLYFGSAGGLKGQAAWTRVGTQRSLFGDCSGPAGDFDRDGKADVVIGAYGHAKAQGSAFVFRGGAQGLSADPIWSGYGEAASDWYGYSVASAGDVNGDGHNDLVIGAKHAGQDRPGKAYVYHGSLKGFAQAASWSAEGQDAEGLFGWRAVSAGDVNKDGYADLAVAGYLHDGPAGKDSGQVKVYCGSAKGLGAEPCWAQTGSTATSLFGMSIAGGDFDKDGYSDLLVGSPGLPKSRILLYKGGPQGLAPSPALVIEGEGKGGGFGTYVANVGDVNGDGFTDALIGAPTHSEVGEWQGKAYLYYGSPTGLKKP